MKGIVFMLPYIGMVVLFMYLMFNNNKQIGIIGGIMFILGFAIYYLNALYHTFIVWKRDKEDGSQEAIVEYIRTYSTLPSNGSKGTFSPGCISASFKILNMFDNTKSNMIGEIISLTGDVKNQEFVAGKKYRVAMKIHSKRLIYLENFPDEEIIEKYSAL